MAKFTKPDDFLSLLKGVKSTGNNQYMALCPAHDDKNQSLSVKLADGKILLKCFAGCVSENVLQALGLEIKDLFLNGSKPKSEHREIGAIYDYVDIEGALLFQVVRTKPKGFYQRRLDGKGGYINNLKGITPVLYHLDDISRAIKNDDLICIVEGEKDCDNLWNIGLVATTNPMGAGKWRDSYSDILKESDVVISPDNDSSGYEHTSQVAKSLYGKAKRIRILELPREFKDISDWLKAGHTRGDFDNLILQAKDYAPGVTVGLRQDTKEILDVALPEIAWQGLFGDYRGLVGETTEAADVFHYAAFSQVIGSTLGRRLYVHHATRLYPNFYICIVGRSSLTRKDTCQSRAADILGRLHDIASESGESPEFRIVRGIRSYEGLLDELAGERKVRLILVGELLSLLAKARQESLGNIVPQLTELYDCPDLVNPPVHQKNKVIAREPFVSIMAGTTQAWLQKALSERDIYGGFANRWLYFYGLPKDPKPNPPKVDNKNRDNLLQEINQIRLWAESIEGGEITISEDAKDLFTEYYRDYYQRCQLEGLIPTLIARIQDFIWKLALLYAAINLSGTIKVEHLKPAIAVGDYLEASVTEVFRSFTETRGKQSENKVVEWLKSKGRPMEYRDVYRALNMSARELDQCVGPLIKLGLIKNRYNKRTRTLEAL